nr:PKD domain-containing protein [Cutibacterium modestum]
MFRRGLRSQHHRVTNAGRNPFDQLGRVPGVRMRAAVIGQSQVRRGNPLSLDASSSYTSIGRIRRWQWDLNGDGRYELTTTTTDQYCRAPLNGLIIGTIVGAV